MSILKDKKYSQYRQSPDLSDILKTRQWSEKVRDIINSFKEDKLEDTQAELRQVNKRVSKILSDKLAIEETMKN